MDRRPRRESPYPRPTVGFRASLTIAASWSNSTDQGVGSNVASRLARDQSIAEYPLEIDRVLIQLASPDTPRLIAFYRDVLQLPLHGMGPHNFAIGADTILSIQHHSQVSGPTKEPTRVIFDFWVKDIDAEQARLEVQGVRFSRSKGLEYWGGVISTFSDPDGNTIQLIQHKPELRTSPSAP